MLSAISTVRSKSPALASSSSERMAASQDGNMSRSAASEELILPSFRFPDLKASLSALCGPTLVWQSTPIRPCLSHCATLFAAGQVIMLQRSLLLALAAVALLLLEAECAEDNGRETRTEGTCRSVGTLKFNPAEKPMRRVRANSSV